jgi:hypothetical protein
MLRDTIFGLERRMQSRKLRQEVLDLCRYLSPAPEISFAGPVDEALDAGARGQARCRRVRPGVLRSSR